MSENSYVCFAIKGQPTINEPYDNLFNMKTSEILSKMQNESQYLCIHTPLYTKPLQMDSYPIKDFKELSVSSKYLKYDRPEFYLTFEPTFNFIDIRVTPQVKQNFEIPPYYVRFEIDELTKMTAADVREQIQQQLGLDVNSSKIYFLDSNENDKQNQKDDKNIHRTESNESMDSVDILIENQQIPDEETAQSIIDKAQSKMLYVFFDLSEGAISKIKKRINILAEIISTEKTYINDLRIINENWQPGLQKYLSSDDFQLVFKDIAVIKTCHQSFLSNLESEGSKYGSKVATPFIEFSNFFKVSQQYIANYPEISEILKKYEKNKKMKQKMTEIADSLDGRDLYSYLITPVQRMPRYLLFLRDLLKITMQSHPDSELLPIAYESIDEVTKRIDKSAETSKNQQSLMKLQKMITNFTFLDKQRNLVLNTKVTITNGSSTKNGGILVFDDLLVIFKEGKESKAIFDSPIRCFHYQMQRPDNLSITVDSTDKKYISKKAKQKGNELLFHIKFNNAEEMQKFFEEIEKLQEMEMFKYEKQSNRYIFKWNAAHLQRHLPTLSRPFISGFEGSLLIISSNEDNQYSSAQSTPDIYRVALSNGTIFKVDAKFPPLKLPISIAHYKKSLYFINEDKLYKYDQKKNKLSTIQATFTPRVGYSAAFCGDNLMIFGGKSTLTNQPLNDLIVYNANRDMLMIVNPHETTPQPRWRHCSFSHKDKLYIFGGETADGSVNNDLYSYEPVSGTWSKLHTTGDTLVARKDGKAVTTGHYVILIGGDVSKNTKSDTLGSEEDLNKPQIYNFKKKTVQTVENFGNVPPLLTNFDAVFSPNNSSLCAITPKNLYNISTPAILQKSSSSKHFDETEETLLRSSQDNLSFFPFKSSSSKKNHKRSHSPHAISKQDRNSISFEQFSLDKSTELDIHEKPLNDQERLLLQDSEGSRSSANATDDEIDEESVDDTAAKARHHRKRGKTHIPLIPRPKMSPQNSSERFVDVTNQTDDESSSEFRSRATLSICNAFPESLQNELTKEDDQKAQNSVEKSMNVSFCYENDQKAQNSVEKSMNVSFCYENDQKAQNSIEKSMNVTFCYEDENREVTSRAIEKVPEKIEKKMIVSFLYENKDYRDQEIEEEEEDRGRESKTIQVSSHESPKKLERVMDISLMNEQKVTKERSVDLIEKVPEKIEKKMIVSFLYENKDYRAQEIEEEEEDKDNESKTIHTLPSSGQKRIEKVMDISLAYENENGPAEADEHESENEARRAFVYSPRNEEQHLSVDESLAFEVQAENAVQEKKFPVVAIAATAAVSVLLTAGAFFVFRRMRK